MVIPLAGGTKENMVKITTTRKEINGRKPRYFRFEFMQEVNVNDCEVVKNGAMQ